MRKFGFVCSALALCCVSCEAEEQSLPAPSEAVVSVKGSVCAAPALEAWLPTKVLFVVDVSGSVQFTDPSHHRVEIVRGAVEALLDHPAASVAIATFSEAVLVHTQTGASTAFTRDPEVLARALDALERVDGLSDHQVGLEQAFRLLVQDLEATAPEVRARTRYSIIDLVDGLPFPMCCSEQSDRLGICTRGPDIGFCGDVDYNLPHQLVEVAQDIASLGEIYGAGQVSLHTSLFLDTEAMGSADARGCYTQPAVEVCPEDVRAVLEPVAVAGGGVYDVLEGIVLDTRRRELGSLSLPTALGAVWVEQPALRFEAEGLALDADEDGLSDPAEAILGTDGARPDSDGDGFSDAFEARDPGLAPTRSDPGCGLEARSDVDGDGLLACEEARLGTDDGDADSDRDGLVDGLEVRSGTDPMRDDAAEDLDGDGRSNRAEIEAGLRADLAEGRAAEGFGALVSLIAPPDGSPCLEFEASNVRIPAVGPGYVRVHVTQRLAAPHEGPTAVKTACVAVGPQDSGATFEVAATDFVSGLGCPELR